MRTYALRIVSLYGQEFVFYKYLNYYYIASRFAGNSLFVCLLSASFTLLSLKSIAHYTPNQRGAEGGGEERGKGGREGGGRGRINSVKF